MATQFIYDAAGKLVGVYEGPGVQENSTLIPPPKNAPQARFINGNWVVEMDVAHAPLPLLTPMTLYMAFTPAERIAIKASKDPMVAEFWSMYQLSVQLDKPTDPNLASVRDIIAYLAKPASPGPGGGILASPERVQQILAGIPQ